MKEENTWICEKCGDLYSKEVNYCRKCALRERKAKFRAKYLKK